MSQDMANKIFPNGKSANYVPGPLIVRSVIFISECLKLLAAQERGSYRLVQVTRQINEMQNW